MPDGIDELHRGSGVQHLLRCARANLFIYCSDARGVVRSAVRKDAGTHPTSLHGVRTTFKMLLCQGQGLRAYITRFIIIYLFIIVLEASLR